MIDLLCKDIVRQLRIDRFVETGTDKGETIAEVSRWFASIDPDFGAIVRHDLCRLRKYDMGTLAVSYPVFTNVRSDKLRIYSVDLDETSYQNARQKFASNPNVHAVQSSSEAFLRSLLEQEAGQDRRYVFFLDAHWGKYWPLRDEIAVIRTLERYIIVIDDFFVPQKSKAACPHGEFGFDIYQNRILDWAYICDLFHGTKIRVFYPTAPNRDQRGWVLLTHGYGPQELEFLKNLKLFEMDPWDPQHTAKTKTVWRSHLDAKNILKTIVPVHVLRGLHRMYERVIR